MIRFAIAGTVREAETLHPLAGWWVKAYDRDLVFDDVLGSAVTDGDGRFRIDTEVRDFRELIERQPDVYFRVARSAGQDPVYSTEAATDFDAALTEAYEILVPIDRVFDPDAAAVTLTGDDGAPREAFEGGESVRIAVSGLRPIRAHDIRVEAGGAELFTIRLITNRRGHIEPTVLWPQAFLDDPRREGSLTLDEAREQWAGARLRIAVLDGEREVLEAAATYVAEPARPLVFASDADGRPRNGFEAGSDTLHVTVTGLEGGGVARVWMVPRQRDWHPGDAFMPAALADGRRAEFDVKLRPGGPTTVSLVDTAQLLPGPYDFIVRQIRYGYEQDEERQLHLGDAVTRHITGLVVREEFWTSKMVLGGCVNKLPISGRTVSGSPYFNYADTFEVGQDVWGAIDPGAVDPGNVGKMCALYVVQSKTDTQWNNDTSLNHLAVLGGNAAVQKIKVQPGCVNCNRILLWPGASAVGEYDIVADFGNNTPEAAMFAPNNSYDTPLDCIDGYVVAGFRVVRDPGTTTDFAHAGNFNYVETTNIAGFGVAGSVTVEDENTHYHAPGAFTPVNINVPRKANVYFPADAPGVTDPSQISAAAANYPVIVIVHGNGHSYTSYDALLQHFAKNGFIAASVHLNGGMSALGRANVFFQHMPILQAMFGAKAQNNVGLIGHSRGGEAILKAARLNSTGGLGLSINAVAPLAPTDQYGSEVLAGAWATPMFLLYGSRDGDIDGGIWTPGYTVPQTGFAEWDRTSGASKMSVFVHRATHNGFITSNYDADAGDVPSLLPPADQQKVTFAYMNAFFRRYLKGEDFWDGMFSGHWRPASVPAPVELYTQFRAGGSTTVDDFQSGAAWNVTSAGGTAQQTGLPQDPNEGKLHDHPNAPGIDAHSPHDSRGLRLRWDSNGDELVFTLAAAADVSAFSAISMRISQTEASAQNPVGQPQNLRVALRDAGGQERAVRSSAFGVIPYPDQRNNPATRKSAMTTIRIPLSAYTIVAAGAPQVDLSQVVSVKLRFTEIATGEIDVDDIEFTA